MTANFLTGPVALHDAVRAAFRDAPLAHRDTAFRAMLGRTRAALCALVNAPRVALLVGSGTLANDAVAAQLAHAGAGLVLANGEFGERLADHAHRFDLDCRVHAVPWGEPFDWSALALVVARERPAWIWAALCETSTGVFNPLDDLRGLAARCGASLCVDAISAIGLGPVDLRGIRFATGVSGKGLAAFPGLAAVFHDGSLATAARIPRYLDLAYYEAMDGVPFTHSSNLVAALDCALSSTDWPEKFAFVASASRELRRALSALGLKLVAAEEHAAPGVISIAIPDATPAAGVALALEREGMLVAHQSHYLRRRNWLQLCLMGEIERDALRRAPAALARCVAHATARGPDALAYAPR